MWHTSRGDRTLRGEEAALVRIAIDSMIDSLLIHLDDDFEEARAACETGIAVYDALSPSQRIALLHDVARYLLTETESAVPLSSTLEATIAAIYADVRDQIAIEIDFLSMQPLAEESDPERWPRWRRLVLDAYTATFRPQQGSHGRWAEMLEELPDESCRDIRLWVPLIDALADAILWDRDFELAEAFLDADPGVSRKRRRLLGIEEDYFTSVAPDPRPEDVQRLVSFTREIVRRKPR